MRTSLATLSAVGIWPTLATSGLLCLSVARGAEVRWIRLQSANFEMYSSAGEKSTRETLKYFEQVRGFFAQAMPSAMDQPLPVRIVAFGSRKEYDPYRINEFATAYYQGTAERDYIVLSETGETTFPTAVHEYFHLVARHANLSLPPWLNEGMAELYSTLKPMGDKIQVGALAIGRFRALRVEKWVPIAAILAAGRDSPYYNEKDKAGSLYNEGWALTHMLALSPDYRPKFTQLLSLIQAGTNSADALAKIYSKTLPEIEDDLQIYLQGRIFQSVMFPMKLEDPSVDMPFHVVAPFDVKLMLADLMNRPGREVETEKTLEGLTHEAPQRPEPYATLGYLALRRGNKAAAQKDFETAFGLGGREPRMLWDYGRMIEQNNPAVSILVLRELLRQQPDRTDALLELASIQLRSKQPRAALETIGLAHHITEADAPKLFTIVAYAQLENGNRDEALKATIGLASVAKTREDRLEADRLLKHLGDAAGQAENRSARDEPAADRRGSITGSFVQLACEGMQAKLVLETPSGKKFFLVEDPSNVRISYQSDETVDLPCGPHPPVKVLIEYTRPGSAQPGIDGVVGAIHFEP